MTAASVLGAASYWVPEVLQRDYGMTSGQVAALYGATLLVSALAGAATGIVAGRFFSSASRGFAATSFAYAIVAFAFLAFITKYANVCLAAIAFFVVVDGATSVILMTSIQTVTPPRLRGVTASLDRLFGVSLGYSIGQPLVGLVATHFQGKGVNLAGAMLIVAIPAGLVASALLLLTALASRRFGQD
jgi:MFS family permease